MNGAVVTSRKRGLGMIFAQESLPCFRPDTFQFDALPSPNWLWLSVVPENGSVLVLNGVHHVAALLRAGRRLAFGLIRQGPLQAIMNFHEPGIFKPECLLQNRCRPGIRGIAIAALVFIAPSRDL